MKSIFVSSTFKDMQYERDLINNYIWPKLNHLANKYNERLYFTDLRWGVNTEDLDSDEGSKKVLEVCFDEILKSKPYMIILIGERYGWIPNQSIIDETVQKYNIDNKEEKSVTELEIQFGALSQENLSNCIFCFREELDKTNLPEELKKSYGAEDEKHKEKLNHLKQEILKRNPEHVIYYNGKFDEKGNLELSPNLAEEIEKILSQKIVEEYKNKEQEIWQENEYQKALSMIQNQNVSFVGREELIKEYVSKMKAQPKKDVFVLEGEAGSGRTSVVCKLYEELSKDANFDVYPFFMGMSQKSLSFLDVLNQVNYYLAKKLEMKEFLKDTQDFWEARENHIKLMIEYTKKTSKILLVLVDGIEQGIYSDITKNFEWILHFKNEMFFITQTPNFAQVDPNYDNEILKDKSIEYLKMPNLTQTEKMQIINSICTFYNKQLSETIKQTICNLENANNPLYLQLVLERLIKMSKKDFDEIRKSGDNMSAINQVQLKIISQMPKDLSKNLRAFLDYSSEVLETKTSREALNIIIASECQLTRKELEQILKQNHYDWNDLKFSALLQYLSMLVFEDEQGKVIFMHLRTVNSILNEEERKKYANMILAYLKTLEPDSFLKRTLFVTAANTAGEPSEILEYAKQLYQQNDIDNVRMLCAAINHLVDNQNHDEKWIPELLKNVDIKNDKKFLEDCFIKEILEILTVDFSRLSFTTAQQFINELLRKIQNSKEEPIDIHNMVQQLYYYMGKIAYVLQSYPMSEDMFKRSLEELKKVQIDEITKLKREINILFYVVKIYYYQNKTVAENCAMICAVNAEELVKLENSEENVNLLIDSYRILATLQNNIQYGKKAMLLITELAKRENRKNPDIVYLEELIKTQYRIAEILRNLQQWESAQKMFEDVLTKCFTTETNTAVGYEAYRKLIQMAIEKQDIPLAKKLKKACFDHLDYVIYFKYPLNKEQYMDDKNKLDMDLLQYLDEEEWKDFIFRLEYKSLSKDKQKAADAHKQLARVYLLKGMEQKALTHLKLEYQIYEDLEQYAIYGEDMVIALRRMADVYLTQENEEEAKQVLLKSYDILKEKMEIYTEHLVQIALGVTPLLGKILAKQKDDEKCFEVQQFEYEYLHRYYLYDKENRKIKLCLMQTILHQYLSLAEGYKKDNKLTEEIIITALDIHASLYHEKDTNYLVKLMFFCDVFEVTEYKLSTFEKVKEKYEQLIQYFKNTYGDSAENVIEQINKRIQKLP